MGKVIILIHIKTSLVLFLIFKLTLVQAQETIFEETTTIIKTESSFGIGAHTNGYQLTYRSGKYITATKKQMFEIELANIKHPREIRSIDPRDEDVRGFVFGKLNAFYALRPSIGVHKILFPKQSLRGVSIAYVSHIGPSIGMAKPVYLNIVISEPFRSIQLGVQKFDPELHNESNIYGRASFFNGVDEIKFFPGVFAKLGLHFDYGEDRETVRSIEVGITVDGYFKRIPILAYTQNKLIYPNFYFAFFFGNKNLN